MKFNWKSAKFSAVVALPILFNVTTRGATTYTSPLNGRLLAPTVALSVSSTPVPFSNRSATLPDVSPRFTVTVHVVPDPV
ncbi:MAG: hypothetical protein ACK559_31005, partial [bacterium]